MKITFLVLMGLMVSPLYATVRTVSNHPSTLAQFSTIQAAINASTTGDTVLIHGSPFAYNGFAINNKKICFLGPGRGPDAIPGFLAQIVASPNITISGALASGSEFQGLYINNTINITAPIPSDLFFSRNLMSSPTNFAASGTYSGYIFRNNFFFSNGILAGNAGSQFQNFIIENNLIRNNATFFMNTFQNCLNVFLVHNLFFNPAQESNRLFFNCSGFTLVNNIFNERNICPPPADAGLTASLFINNITWNSPDSLGGNDTPWTCGGNTDGGGNIEDMNPMMVDQVLVDNGSAGATSNFTIPSGPANNSGSDGKDLGLLFDPVGGNNWNHGRNSRMPSMVTLNIANPVIGAGGTLSVSVEARKNE